MNGIANLFLLVNAVTLLTCPRCWAPLPLLIGACYMTFGQVVAIGPFHFTVIRLLVLTGFIRALLRGERPAGGLNRLDGLLLAWAAWALISSAFHNSPGDTLVTHLGLIYNALGIYFLIRTFCQSVGDIARLVKIIAVLLVPVALVMVMEQLTGRNLFTVFGGLPESALVRDGRVRSQGPFAISILAGTVGAGCVPLMVGIWRRQPLAARIGLVTCLVMVAASASSGPLMSVLFGVFALVLWRWRHLTRQMRIAAVLGYVVLDLVMTAPAYYLIARVDLTGSSTGWHRAALIESSIKHLHEWWFAGTDYTRDWMPTGVSWSPDHTDITNYYLHLGVLGGLPLMLLFIAVLGCAFHYVGRFLRLQSAACFEDQFLIWAFGASLFAHAASAVSISYFDQSFLFLYLNLGVIGSLFALSSASRPEVPSADDGDSDGIAAIACGNVGRSPHPESSTWLLPS